jgi:hypothetical protein
MKMNIQDIWQGEARQRGFILAVVKITTVQVAKLPL